MAYIYEIRNKINGKVYIGSTVNYKKRKYTHIYQFKRNRHFNKHLQSAWNKYGELNFKFTILEECQEFDKFRREKYYIDLVLDLDKNQLYNIDFEPDTKFSIRTLRRECVNCGREFSTTDRRNNVCEICEFEELSGESFICDDELHLCYYDENVLPDDLLEDMVRCNPDLL